MALVAIPHDRLSRSDQCQLLTNLFTGINLFSDFDVLGKPQSGFLFGNVGWLGSYSECTKAIVDAHYCLAYVTVPALDLTKVSSLDSLLAFKD